MSKLSQTAIGLAASGLMWAALGVQAQTPPPPAPPPPATTSGEKTPAQRMGLFVFGEYQQTPETQLNDETACYAAAKTASGVDPERLSPTYVQAPTYEGGAARGAVGGAAVGAVGGAIGGNAGKGAAIGAVVGVIGGARRQQQANAQAQQNAAAQAAAAQQRQISTFKRAMSACLESKNYTVK
jgi:hypothetical protein